LIPIRALLAGDLPSWKASSTSVDQLVAFCNKQEIAALVYHRIATTENDWPSDVRDRLAEAVRLEAARELIRVREITAAVDALAASGVHAILLKGAALAYTVYPFPACRPRSDTDLIVREQDLNSVRSVFAARGYSTTPHCSELFHQFEVAKTDPLGVTHAFDVHWSISAQPAFAKVLTYERMRVGSQRVTALGINAYAPSMRDSLLLACVHPVMHHKNEERLLWMYDIHLLGSFLSSDDWEAFVAAASAKNVAAVCAHSLRRARTLLGTAISGHVIEALESVTGDERSAKYLLPNRRWHHEVVASVRDLPGWRARVRLLCGVLFPPVSYMRGAYRTKDTAFGVLMLPILYLHRNLFGAWKVLAGKK